MVKGRSSIADVKAHGLYGDNYLDDRPIHFSNPAYLQIKPNYRPNYPLPNFNNIEMKGLYSLKPFGNPILPRPNQDVKTSVFRQTMQ